MSECPHKHVEDVTSFEDQEPVWICLDCGETVPAPKEDNDEYPDDEGLPLQEETGQEILQALKDIKICLLDIALSVRKRATGDIYGPGHEA